MTRDQFRKAYGVTRLALKTPTQMTPAAEALDGFAKDDTLSILLKVWMKRIHMVSGGECFAAETPREGFTRQDSIRACLRAVRYRAMSRRLGRSTGSFDPSPIPA